MKKGIVILDFGSQVTQLIARRLRELEVYSEIHPYDYSLEKIKSLEPVGIILSGGPSSVYDADSPKRSVVELQNIAPILGICYGMQLMAHELGGIVQASHQREYGHALIRWSQSQPGVPLDQKVWMSHGDVVKVPPPGFEIVAMSEHGHAAAMKGERALAVQFHPEVSHTDHGTEILKNFAFEICKAEKNWTMRQQAPRIIEQLKKQIPENEKVLCALSGGVDSTVVGVLLTKALGAERVHCVFVNNGLLRQGEFKSVLDGYKKLGLNVHGIDAEILFLSSLKGKSDPEEKRKTIGRVFIEVFEDAVKSLPEGEITSTRWLAQGTLYPDVIESVNVRGANVTIKSHHNVGGLPEKMNMKLVEPLREMFKDEVRALGRELGIPAEFLDRHPFPGPGLAIRVIGEVTKESLDVLRRADHVYINELRANGLYDKIWQAFCVLLPVKTVGVQGDGRSYERSLALRAVTSLDGMTADWFEFEPAFLRRVSNKITNEVREINRVVYDITSKPPGTIEWE